MLDIRRMMIPLKARSDCIQVSFAILLLLCSISQIKTSSYLNAEAFQQPISTTFFGYRPMHKEEANLRRYNLNGYSYSKLREKGEDGFIDEGKQKVKSMSQQDQDTENPFSFNLPQFLTAKQDSEMEGEVRVVTNIDYPNACVCGCKCKCTFFSHNKFVGSN